MSEISMYEAQKKKMQGLCDEHELSYRFGKNCYPITFTLYPLQGMDAQITLLEMSEENGYISPDASMSWIFEDGNMQTKVTGGTFTISKALRTKIESVLMKMITYWQQYFFRDVMEKKSLRAGLMPVIDEDDADDAEEMPEEEFADESDGTDDSTAEEAAEIIETIGGDLKIREAIRIVRVENKASASLLQRRMNIGYAEAAHLIDELEDMGVIGPYRGAEPREVLPADLPEEDTDDE